MQVSSCKSMDNPEKQSAQQSTDREARGNKIKQMKLPQLVFFILEILKASCTVALKLTSCFNRLLPEFPIGLN